MAKVMVNALRRGTRVSPSTGQPVHFNPDSKRNPLSRTPLVDERDVKHFMDQGFAEDPGPNAQLIGAEEERRIVAEVNKHIESTGSRAAAALRGANRIDRDLPGNSGLDTLATTAHSPTSPAASLRAALGDEGDRPAEDEDEGGEGGEGGDGLAAGDPDAPPVVKPAPKGGKPAAAKG